ncbi:MAG: DUF2911 domain-containing protein [Cyclobacteriaceae bacterium]|nr:DUF2911 domain-containing protein [Cyclobacteriaceae bacterium]MCH8516450.1 DUF2911 domain-containing protein [Cyclobacteriaceae bacterium]
MKTKFHYILLVLFFFAWDVNAQLSTPQPSPSTKITQEFGLNELTIEYARPSMKGRTIFGDLVPYDKVWRTGANAATKLTFKDDVLINGQELAKGTYALFSIPSKDEWTIIISNNVDSWGTGRYNEEDDVLRFKVKPQTIANTTQTFTILPENISITSMELSVSWENTKVTFAVETEVDSKVDRQIAQLLSPARDAGIYYQAANYYFEKGKDLDKAEEWINKSVEMNPRFWTVHLQAKILAKNGKSKEAKKAANKSIELAKEAGNDDYVRLNQNLIKTL